MVRAMGESCLVHVCGFPSGGTDLLRNIMSSHPDVEISGEFPLLPTLASRFGAEVHGDRLPELVEMLNRVDVYHNFSNPSPDLSAFSGRGSVSVADVYRAMLGGRPVRWKGNKTPQNCENVGRLLRLFPDSCFVLVVRDIRDVCLSWGRKWGRNPLLCAARWQERTTRGLDALASLPSGQGLILRYEDVLLDLPGVSRRLCAFLDVEFSENMLGYHEHVEETVDGKRKFGQPVDPRNTGKWRAALRDRTARRVEEIAYEAMRRLDYRPELATGHRPIKAVEKYAGYGQDVYAMIMIGNRYSSRNRFSDRLRRGRVTLQRRLRSR